MDGEIDEVGDIGLAAAVDDGASEPMGLEKILVRELGDFGIRDENGGEIEAKMTFL